MCSEKESGTPRGASGSARALAVVVAAFHHPDAPLDLADIVQVAVHPLPVRVAELLADLGHIIQDPVEDAAPGRAALGALLGSAARPEQHLERDARVADHRQRLARRRPTDRVGVGAGVVVGAAAGLVQVLDAQLQRGHRRGLAELPRVELVQRGADEQVGTLGLLRVALGQEHRGGAEVVPADLRRAERLGHPHIGVADDRQVVAERLQGLQRVVGQQLEIAPHRGRREQVAVRAPSAAAGQPVDLLDADEAGRLRCRRREAAARTARRRHRVEERERDRGAHSPQEGPAGQVLSGDQGHGVPPVSATPVPSARLRWKASLRTTPMMNDAIR